MVWFWPAADHFFKTNCNFNNYSYDIKINVFINDTHVTATDKHVSCLIPLYPNNKEGYAAVLQYQPTVINLVLGWGE